MASSSWSCCFSGSPAGGAFSTGAAFSAGAADGGVWSTDVWANAPQLAPSGNARARAEPSTRRGSVERGRRRIMLFTLDPSPKTQTLATQGKARTGPEYDAVQLGASQCSETRLRIIKGGHPGGRGGRR